MSERAIILTCVATLAVAIGIHELKKAHARRRSPVIDTQAGWVSSSQVHDGPIRIPEIHIKPRRRSPEEAQAEDLGILRDAMNEKHHDIDMWAGMAKVKPARLRAALAGTQVLDAASFTRAKRAAFKATEPGYRAPKRGSAKKAPRKMPLALPSARTIPEIYEALGRLSSPPDFGDWAREAGVSARAVERAIEYGGPLTSAQDKRLRAAAARFMEG